MKSAVKTAPSSTCSSPKISPSHYQLHKTSSFLPKLGYGGSWNGAVLPPSSRCSAPLVTPLAVPCAAGDVHGLASLFCYDKPIPEEIIEKPIGISFAEKNVGENPRCPSCQAKGANLCSTCSGSGLYVDSILESQGIIVKVRCLGCGGTGNTMCSKCGGRGHI